MEALMPARGSKRIVASGCALLTGIALLWSAVSIANAAARDQISESFAVLARVQKPADVPDRSLFQAREHGRAGIEGQTSRVIGMSGTARFYIAEDAVSNVCLLVVDRGAEFTASTCAPSNAVTTTPLGLKTTYLQETIEAFLLPDGVELQVPTGWERTGENLVLVVETESDIFQADATSPDGSKFQLQRFADPPMPVNQLGPVNQFGGSDH